MTLRTNLRKTLVTAAIAATAFGPIALAPGASAIMRTDIDLNDGSPSIVIHNPDGEDIMTLDAPISIAAEDATDPTDGGIEYRDEEGNLVDPVVPAENDIDRSGLARDAAETAATSSGWLGRIVSGLIGAAAGLGLGRALFSRRRTETLGEAEARGLAL